MRTSLNDVIQLRMQTGANLTDIKKALLLAEGNFEDALEILKKKS